MRKTFHYLVTFCREYAGQDLVEYTLLIGFLALAAIGVLSQVGVSVTGTWGAANTTFTAAAGATPAPATPPPATPPSNRDDDRH